MVFYGPSTQVRSSQALPVIDDTLILGKLSLLAVNQYIV